MELKCPCSSCGKEVIVSVDSSDDQPNLCRRLKTAICEECQDKRAREQEEKIRAERLKTLDGQLEERFVCGKCGNKGAVVERIATTGDGVSRLFDVQCHRFIVVSCNRCGYSEMYNLKVLEADGDWLQVADIILNL